MIKTEPKRRVVTRVRKKTSGKTQGNKSHPKKDRALEEYQTPPEAVLALMGVEALPRMIWEPACGDGNIVKVLRGNDRVVLASDIIKRPPCLTSVGQIDFVKDGGKYDEPEDIEAIITNPPFSRAPEFILKGLEVAPVVYMLLRLNFLEGGSRDPLRKQVLERAGMKAIYVFSDRLPMMHRKGWTGKKAGSQVAYAWFVWKRGFRGAPKVKRISWQKPRPPKPAPEPKQSRKRCRKTMEMYP